MMIDVTFEAGETENGGGGGLKGSERINSECLNRFELFQGEAREYGCHHGFVRAMRCCCRTRSHLQFCAAADCKTAQPGTRARVC